MRQQRQMGGAGRGQVAPADLACEHFQQFQPFGFPGRCRAAGTLAHFDQIGFQVRAVPPGPSPENARSRAGRGWQSGLRGVHHLFISAGGRAV